MFGDSASCAPRKATIYSLPPHLKSISMGYFFTVLLRPWVCSRPTGFGAWGWELCSPKKSSLICLPVQTQPPPPNSYYCWYVTCHSTQDIQQPHMACTPIIIHENHAPSTCLFGKQVLADWDIKNETRSSLLLLFISHMQWLLSHSYIIFFLN